MINFFGKWLTLGKMVTQDGTHTYNKIKWRLELEIIGAFKAFEGHCLCYKK